MKRTHLSFLAANSAVSTRSNPFLRLLNQCVSDRRLSSFDARHDALHLQLSSGCMLPQRAYIHCCHRGYWYNGRADYAHFDGTSSSPPPFLCLRSHSSQPHGPPSLLCSGPSVLVIRGKAAGTRMCSDLRPAMATRCSLVTWRFAPNRSSSIGPRCRTQST